MYAICHKSIARNAISAFYVSTGSLGRKTYFSKDIFLPYLLCGIRLKTKLVFWQTFIEGLSKLHSICPVEHFEQRKTLRKIFFSWEEFNSVKEFGHSPKSIRNLSKNFRQECNFCILRIHRSLR